MNQTDPELTRSLPPRPIERAIRGRRLLWVALPYLMSVIAIGLLAWG